ncbi:hypothetical protein AVEN_61999-1 [Araneus ventricosus]|uniref:Uncharacterized protein n=1 Tax=Araneus ventricosus TaxID=182803 RepID=A0A4Y2ECM5_ARAVE|nr:hypothetical protein AVEN_61999-1 [Araneus ventricosus]
MACGGWNSVWTEIGAKTLETRFRGTLKEASEKNNALRRLKPRFEAREESISDPAIPCDSESSLCALPLPQVSRTDVE